MLDLLLLKLLSSFLDFPLLFFLLLTDFLLHLFHLFVDVLIHLELLKLLLVGLLHRFVPVITRFTVDQWVHVEIVLVVTNKDSITVLELIWIFKQLTIHLDFELARILIVWHECGRSVITVEVQATLLISDTDTLDSDSGREVIVLLTHVVITLVKSILNHAAHTWVLINVTDLRGGLQSRFLRLLFGLLAILLFKLSLELKSFGLDRGKSLLLLLNFPLQLFIGFAATSSTTSCCSATTSW